MVIRNVHHIGIDTTDIQESVRFYTEVLGLEYLGVKDLGDDRAAYVSVNEESVLELFASMAPVIHNGERAGIRHMAFAVDDLDEWRRRLEEYEVKILLEPVEIPAIGEKVMLFQAPDDVVIEFTEKI